MILQGKGFFTSNLPDCELGDPAAILAVALNSGLSHVIVKIADGVNGFGLDASGTDLTAVVVETLQAAGIAAWGWHTIYGNNPSAEADIAIARTQALGLNGYVVVPGEEYNGNGMTSAARQFMAAVRGALKIPIALSSFRFPNYHPEIPWSSLLEYCDLHMPKVYWEQGHNAGAQLRESKRQCDALPHAKTFIPAGAAYITPGWTPTAEDGCDFLNTARSLNIPAVNFFNWDTCRRKLAPFWETVAGFAWPAPPQDDLPVQAPAPALEMPIPDTQDALMKAFLAALNSQHAAQMIALYDPSATQVWADQIMTGAPAIQAGYAAFFSSLPAGTIFTVSRAHADNDQRQLTWKVGSFSGETTLVIKNDRIILDYTLISGS